MSHPPRLLPPPGNPEVQRVRRTRFFTILLGAGALALTGCAGSNAADHKAVVRRQPVEEAPNPARETLNGAQLEHIQQKTMVGQ